MKVENLLTTVFVLLFNFSSFSQIQIGEDLDGDGVSHHFGIEIELSANGKRVAIGALGDIGGKNYVRIFDNNNGTWTKVGSDLESAEIEDGFGLYLSMSYDGKKIAVGALEHVKVFEEVNSVWMQIGNNIAVGSDLGLYGRSVDLSADGKRIVVGGKAGSSINGAYSGVVRIFEEDNNTWQQVGNDIFGEAANDEAGRSVSISSNGKRVAIGSTWNSGNGVEAGHTRIFRETVNGEWVQVGDDIDGVASEDKSGRSISLSNNGKRIAIGASGNDGNGFNSGHVRVFEENNFVWTQVGSDIYGEDSLNGCGGSVSLSGDGKRLVEGSPGNANNGIHSGQARVFEEQGGEWVQIGADIIGENESDSFGHDVVISKNGKTVAVSAWNNDDNGSNSGHVRVFGDLNTTPTSLGDFEKKQDIYIFPNPTQEEFNVQIDSLQESDVHIVVRDYLGRSVLEKRIERGGTEIKESFSIEEKGVYFVSVNIGIEVNTYRLVVTQN